MSRPHTQDCDTQDCFIIYLTYLFLLFAPSSWLYALSLLAVCSTPKHAVCAIARPQTLNTWRLPSNSKD
jgi:hypothetical protein